MFFVGETFLSRSPSSLGTKTREPPKTPKTPKKPKHLRREHRESAEGTEEICVLCRRDIPVSIPVIPWHKNSYCGNGTNTLEFFGEPGVFGGSPVLVPSVGSHRDRNVSPTTSATNPTLFSHLCSLCLLWLTLFPFFGVFGGSNVLALKPGNHRRHRRHRKRPIQERPHAKAPRR